jgi:hypothetical protein
MLKNGASTAYHHILPQKSSGCTHLQSLYDTDEGPITCCTTGISIELLGQALRYCISES